MTKPKAKTIMSLSICEPEDVERESDEPSAAELSAMREEHLEREFDREREERNW